ncbi:MAG: hypothetical protein ACYS1A_15710 [Planctomycetota bacterium]|jgi:hypothetical protein
MLKLYAKHYLQPAFLICTALLAVAGVGMSIAVERFELILKKEPLPLKKSLVLLDENSLAPYKVISKEKIENAEIVKNLGTEDYIEWVLEDSDAVADPVEIGIGRYLLFITYYGLPDRVPHIPEECFAGVGYQRLASESMTFEVIKDGVREKIPAKHIVFADTNSNSWGRDTKFSVLYLFNVNGRYVNSRKDTRLVLGKNIFGKSSYFCKVEWYFIDPSTAARRYPQEEQIVAASQKLLGVILPILEKEHWPSFGKETNSE